MFDRRTTTSSACTCMCRCRCRPDSRGLCRSSSTGGALRTAPLPQPHGAPRRQRPPPRSRCGWARGTPRSHGLRSTWVQAATSPWCGRGPDCRRRWCGTPWMWRVSSCRASTLLATWSTEAWRTASSSACTTSGTSWAASSLHLQVARRRRLPALAQAEVRRRRSCPCSPSRRPRRRSRHCSPPCSWRCPPPPPSARRRRPRHLGAARGAEVGRRSCGSCCGAAV
mmetsp:Transcript_13746/g.48514  ORF Transcript_13746/g.48514 Transcript_13746/m.48514 type:complete len:225 (+) Transcript_13746:2338-3012(+)